MTKAEQKLAQFYDYLPSHASRSFGLKNDYIALYQCLTRKSAEIEAELKWFASLIALVVCCKEAFLVVQATEVQLREESSWYHAFYRE